jgi:hypothetical protein
MTTPNLPPIATKISETIWELRAAALKGETTEQQLAIGRVADTLRQPLTKSDTLPTRNGLSMTEKNAIDAAVQQLVELIERAGLAGLICQTTEGKDTWTIDISRKDDAD